jgi:hypothetical protein
MADDNEKYSHYFHAEAHALAGKLILPFKEEIKKQAFVKLEGDSDQLLLEGENQDPADQKAQQNYLSQHAKNFRLEGIVSYAAAHTQVSGHRSRKHKDAFVTLATSVVENLNVLNVVTADRVVAQISTTHFRKQYSPEVTFLGTHFENLRIARHKAEPFLNLDLVGERPEGEKALYAAQGTGLMTAIENQYKRLKAKLAGLSAEHRQSMRPENPDGSLATQYHGFSDLKYGEIQKAAGEASAGKSKWDGITCSLVENVEIKDISVKAADGNSVQIPPPAKSFGHVIHVPGFGTIFLAELSVNHNSFNLTMIRLEMGCLADGSVSLVAANVNGGGGKGGGH